MCPTQSPIHRAGHHYDREAILHSNNRHALAEISLYNRGIRNGVYVDVYASVSMRQLLIMHRRVRVRDKHGILKRHVGVLWWVNGRSMGCGVCRVNRNVPRCCLNNSTHSVLGRKRLRCIQCCSLYCPWGAKRRVHSRQYSCPAILYGPVQK
jgi:hypothetical protein